MSRELDAEVAEKVMGLDLSIAPAHDWQRHDDGEIDMLGMDADTHNGPACRRCGYGFCIHCEGDAGYTAQPCQVSPPAYSTDIAAAWLVIDRMEDLAWMAHLTRVIGGWGCRFAPLPHTERYVYEEEESVALAICRAALAAVGGGEGG